MLKYLATFIQVTRCGSLTAAAASLGTTTSSVSKALAGLERAVGMRLLRRTTRQVRLTPEGETFLQGAVAALSRIDQTVDRLRETRQQPAGLVRLWASVAVGRDHVLPLLHAFLQRHPQVEVEICFDDHMPELVSSGYDLAVRYGGGVVKSNLVRLLCDLPLMLVASPGWVGEHGLPSHPRELTRQPCVVTRSASGRPTVWVFSPRAGSLAGNGSTRRQPIKLMPSGRVRVVEQYDAVLSAAVVGLGATVVFADSAERHLKSGELIALLPEWKITSSGPESSEVFLCYPGRETPPYRVRALAQFIIQWFQSAGTHARPSGKRTRRPTAPIAAAPVAAAAARCHGNAPQPLSRAQLNVSRPRPRAVSPDR